MVSMSEAEILAYYARFHKPTEGKSDDTLSDEGQFHSEIIAYLKSQGVRAVVHSRLDRAATVQVGVPDLLFAFAGTPVALEVKVKNRKPTAAQIAWLHALELDGWIARVVRSMSDVQEALEAAKHK